MSENTLNTTAIIFETLYDVDTKFAKYVDKECDSVSTEVKKWFKKLAVSTLVRGFPRPRTYPHLQ